MTRPYKGWMNPRYLELNKRLMKGRQRPRRERLAARVALQTIGLRYKEIMAFFNPLHTGFRENEKGTIAWLDFIIQMPNKRIAVILFDIQYPGHGVKPHERRGFEDKQQYLKDRKVPFLILKRHFTSQEMEILIRRFIQRTHNNGQ